MHCERSASLVLALCLCALSCALPQLVQAQVITVPPFEAGGDSGAHAVNSVYVATGSDGNVLTAWDNTSNYWCRGQLLPDPSDFYSVRAFSPDGTALSDAIRVDQSGGVEPYGSVGANSGGYFAAWQSTRCAANANGWETFILGRRLDLTANPIGLEFRIDDTLPWIKWVPVVVSLDSGVGVVWWEQPTRVMARLFDQAAQPLGPSFKVADTGSYFWHDAVALENEGFVVVWSSDYPDFISALRVYGSDGQPRSDVLPVNSRFFATNVAANPLGGFAVIGTTRDWKQLWLRYFDDDGTPASDDILVHERVTDYYVSEKEAVFDRSGALLVYWTDFTPEEDTKLEGVVYRGTGVPAGGVSVADLPAVRVASTALRDGGIFNVWEWWSQQQRGRMGVWANALTLCSPGGATCPTPPPTWTPAPTWTPTPTPVPPRCGDGIVSRGEECDDGNLIDGDGCDSNCTVTRCGNGIVTAGEECDDSNRINGDGCDNNCTLTRCGNGMVTAGEECDDGNLIDGDGCDSNCTVTRCGNGIVTSGEECDDGILVNSDGCDLHCLIERCGDGRIEGNEQCDDGNLVDGDGCQSDCTLTPMHDSVLVPIDPIKITIPASQDVFTKVVPVQVRNADIEPKPERPGHLIQLIANDGDCPAGTIVGLPDFEEGTPGDQDSILVMGGTVKTAHVIVQVSRAAFPNLDNKVPQRCTLQFTAQAVVAGNADPTPENNTQAVELNVVAAGNGNGNGAGGISAMVQSSVEQPAFFIVSAKPVKVTLRARQGMVQKKKAAVTVTAGGRATQGLAAQAVTVTASDGDCPAGTVGVSYFNSRVGGAQNVVMLSAGKTARGKLPLTIDAAGFTSRNAKSPARCTALITSTADGTLGPNNHLTKLLIEVTDHNDFSVRR